MWGCGRKEPVFREEENWSRSDWATVLREAKARRGKSMKTCTRRGRLRSTISAGGKQTERINSRNKRRALVTIHQKTT